LGVYRNGPSASLWTASCPALPTFYSPSRTRKGKEAVMSQKALHIRHSLKKKKMFNGERCTSQKLRKSFKIFMSNEHGDIQKGK